MCVIIKRDPGITIPYEKLRSACTVNPDGMGIITIDRGQMHLRKYFFDNGNDVDTLAKSLEDNIEQTSFIHLRYKTRGAVDEANVHPFGVLKQKKHGIDVQFMHNGTMSDFGTKDDCDSKDFVKKILTPLSEKLMAAVGPEHLVTDDTYKAILTKYSGSGVFLVADNYGNCTITNEKSGDQFEGWWASNSYSFDCYHRSTTRTTYPKTWGQSSSQTKPTVATLPSSNTTSDTGTSKPPFNDPIPFADYEEVSPEVATTKHIGFPTRETFCEMSGIANLSLVCGLSNLQIGDMVQDHPDMATLLILDLLKELYDRDQDFEDRADYDRMVA